MTILGIALIKKQSMQRLDSVYGTLAHFAVEGISSGGSNDGSGTL